MNEAEVSKWTKALLAKIHVITGWVIPEDDEYINILLDQFQKKLTSTYFNMNPDEIEFAFNTQGSAVKDWGKSMNLSLIDEVMIPYLEQRATVSRFEEQKKAPMIEHKEDLSDKSMQEWLDSVSKDLVEEKIKLDILPVMVYDWLDRKGKIELDTKMKFVYMDAAALRLQQDGESPEVEKVKKLAKRLALNDYILKNHERISAIGG